MSALEAALSRRSWSKVDAVAPTREELLPLIAAAGRVADHSSLRPWRLIELRGADREVLGAAIAAAEGDSSPSSKPRRAPLLIAVVASFRSSSKVPRWEQEAVASGVAHMLSLLLDEAGWGVLWRTGHYTRAAEVAAVHGLGADEVLLGWLYVGRKPAGRREGRRKTIDAAGYLTSMPSPDRSTQDDEHPATLSKKKRKKLAKKAKKRAKKAKERAKKDAKRRRKAEKALREGAEG